MLGLLILFGTLTIGFGAGYGTREMISRRRRAEYLKYAPYTLPTPRSRQPPEFLVKPIEEGRTRSIAAELETSSFGTRARREPWTEANISHSLQDVPIEARKPSELNFRLVHSSTDAPNGTPATDGSSSIAVALEELLARLQSRTT
jgi:hypothetical protein